MDALLAFYAVTPLSALRRLLTTFDRADLAGVLLLSFMFLLGSGGPLVVSFVVSAEDIDAGRVVLSPPCPTRAVTGKPCATCGMTRALSSLSRLQWSRAVEYNRFAVPVYGGLWLIAVGASIVFVLAVRQFPKAPRRRSVVIEVRHDQVR